MKKITLLYLIVFSVQIQLAIAQSQPLQIIKVPELEQLIKSEEDKVKVINFWATWCKPCIKEIPYFVKARQDFPEVEFVFVSLDFSENASRAESFGKKKGLNKSKMVLIDDVDYNAWIDKVSGEWSGAIPATLIVTPNGKKLYEKEFQQGELKELLKEIYKL
ncbi:thiol-disulfide oxidoreductase [Marivirga lumbricoides]|uniref:Thiol-disulfide oxidoreductase n=1 Tax=Marivirga lumbricoides TaxID=1046115 RepID=A0A2T4DSW2_9BACT|nr:thiol-disulfide oxidoreductase [Marivirga lumbricoides]